MKISIGNLPLKKIEADLFLHPIRVGDSITYEPLAEEAVIGLIAKHFCENVPENVEEYFEEMDDGYLFSESNFDEFDLEKLERGEIIVGKDVLLHPRVENIKKLLFLLREFGGFKIGGIKLPDLFAPSDPELGEILETEKEIGLEEIEELESFDGSVVYECSDFDVVKRDELICSQQFIVANRIKSMSVEVDGEVKKIVKDERVKGTFGIIFNESSDYPFKRVKIKNL